MMNISSGMDLAMIVVTVGFGLLWAMFLLLIETMYFSLIKLSRLNSFG